MIPEEATADHSGGSRTSHGPTVTTQRDGRVSLTALHGPCRAAAAKAARRSLFVVYRRDMPARKRPTIEDAMAARRVLLDGLARDADFFELLGGLESLLPRNDTFPGEVLLRLAGDALEWCGASRADPLPETRWNARPVLA